MTRPAALSRCLALALPFAPAALAEEALGGAAILVAIAGNTVSGSMADGMACAEAYDADGTIRAADYTGAWSVEGDAMCFDYGEGATCWGVAIAGDRVTWIGENGPEGTGTLVPGNPNGF